MQKIYLAGFEVFCLDAVERGNKLKKICTQYGYKGLYPLDNEITGTSMDNPKEIAQEIFNGNIGLIKESDIIIANLNKFRGLEPDSGTAFECGIGHALGKQLYGYIDDIRPLLEKSPVKKEISANQYIDGNRMIIENFKLPLNLMLGCSVTLIEGNFEDCIRALELDETHNESLKREIVNELINDNLSADDVEEIINLTINKEGKTLNKVIYWWRCCGTRWDEQEIINYVSEGDEQKISIEEILSWGTVFKLKSGILVSWDY